ncbi:MAG: hypothetical protein QOJ03_1106 [Frankiaceae bacterium]|nr:hypothetical protein [Frankiaceae bacterium]
MSEHLRILLVVGPSTGGIGRHVHTVAGEMVRRGHDVAVVGPAASAATFDWAATGAAFVPAPIGGASPRALRRATAMLRRAAAERDVVHAHGVRTGAVAAAARLRPLVVTWHNGPHDRWRRRLAHPALEQLVARRADLTLTVSADLSNRAARAGARAVETVVVVAPPLPSAGRSPEAVRSELGVGARPLVLAVGRLEPQKRIDVLVDALAGWPGPVSPVAVVAGTGSLEADLRRQIERTGAPVRLLGRREDVADLMTAADVVVLPSAWEGYPLVAQEALRAGTALIATPVGGVPDLVGPAALLVPAGDPHALQLALRHLVEDPAERRRLGAAGRERAHTWPTTEQMVDRLAQIYLDLTSRSS